MRALNQLSNYTFAPVVRLPDEVEIRDFTNLESASRPPRLPYSIGRYDEDRVGMYEQAIFEGRRTVHMGIDIGAPVGTHVHSFWHGRIYDFGYNAADGDYGHVIVTEHDFDGLRLWALFGHLSRDSIAGKSKGQLIATGEIIGTIGIEAENGGWPPHLHFQLSTIRPQTHDMPGVVAPNERGKALANYPDPRIVLGPIY